jgi:hypothetical protein
MDRLKRALELHTSDTLDWDPLTWVCPGSAGRFGGVM